MVKGCFINPSLDQPPVSVYWAKPNSSVRPRLTPPANPSSPLKPPAPCRIHRSGLGAGPSSWIFLAAAFLFCARLASGITLAELRADKDLTPERLIKCVAGFKFEPGRTVRKAEEFLRQESGDCDDFASLAADLLRQKGYTPRLVAVFMANEVHVVCYVAEIGGYLDYNRRKEPSPLVKCDAALDAIGASVAKSFHTNWVSASEYTFRDGEANFVLTEFR
jgi:hypothetical protein